MKYIIKKILTFFGLTLVKTKYFNPISSNVNLENNVLESKNELIHNGFNLLKKYGFDPKHIIDVGANHGTWTREVLKTFPDSNYTLIEPQKWLSESFADLLEKRNIEFLPLGVGKEKGEFLFTLVDRDDSCNFKMTEAEALLGGFKQIPIAVKTINEIVKESRFGMPDLLKIDAEGLDIEVLEGANEVLTNLEVVLLEASVGNPTFENNVLKVVTYMNGIGFKLFDITDLNRPFSNKVLWLVELMFVKKNGKFSSIDWEN